MTSRSQISRGVLRILSVALAVAGHAACAAEPAPSAPPPLGASAQALFTAGSGGYSSYRIPALAVTGTGTILAFCEGRKYSGGDSGEIDLLVRRSKDHGAHWSEPSVVWHDSGNTCGNPSPVVDRSTGKILVLGTWNRGADHETAINDRTAADTRRVFVMDSGDDGLSWSKPHEITGEVKEACWTWYATGPGAGIQMEKGSHAGRLVIPCDHFAPAARSSGSHVIYSDDGGATWKLGGSSPGKGNECEVVELAGGRLMLNMRNADRSVRNRQVCVSDDGGVTWKDQKPDPQLVEPVCQGAIRRYCWPERDRSGVILFSNPADRESRKNLTLRASHDDGSTWPSSMVLEAGPSAYSDLAVLPDGRIACLYETWEKGVQIIRFATVPSDSLTPPVK